MTYRRRGSRGSGVWRSRRKPLPRHGSSAIARHGTRRIQQACRSRRSCLWWALPLPSHPCQLMTEGLISASYSLRQLLPTTASPTTPHLLSWAKRQSATCASSKALATERASPEQSPRPDDQLCQHEARQQTVRGVIASSPSCRGRAIRALCQDSSPTPGIGAGANCKSNTALAAKPHGWFKKLKLTLSDVNDHSRYSPAQLLTHSG
jgi:hypothetical protein